MIAYDHDGIQVMIGNAVDMLKTIPDESAQCVVTSPPYYGLRSYLPDDHPDKTTEIGLESSLPEFLARLVDVFTAVHRVLEPDGTLWLNMGDSYSSGAGGAPGATSELLTGGRRVIQEQAKSRGKSHLPHKNLMGVPWRLAFALQDAGWILRQEIIWSKPNPMPESVKDRCTKSHEHLFLLTKSSRYYFDAEAIAEPAVSAGRFGVAGWDTAPGGHDTIRHNKPRMGGSKYGDDATQQARTKSGKDYNPTGTRNKRSVWTIAPEPTSEAHFATFPEALVEPCILAGSRPGDVVLDPFVGRGTTLHVAYRLERKGIGIDLNPEYLPMITEPLRQQVLRLESAS